MSAISYDLVAEAGAVWEQSFIRKDEKGQVINHTGYTALMQVRPRVGSEDILLTLTNGDGIDLGEDGEVDLSANDADTATWDFRNAVYDILLTPPNGKSFRFAQGDFRVTPAVTIP